ncbi:uncharacterized protein [Halyomorpha halys]|uniref:uncharacterized protein n=1 Tax=Halyomorpha halys TaxID=286706 RepID=UPI0006D4CD6A
MGLNIPLLNSCCFMSIRTGALIVGGLQLFLFTLYFAQILVIIIRYAVMENIVKFGDLIRDLLIEYVDILNIVFAVILIIGIIKENSGFVASWLLIELTRLVDNAWNTILTSFMYFHISYLIEELLVLGFDVICAWIGYSYYSTMPKSNKYIF